MTARGPENACRETIGTNSKRGVVKIKRSLRLSIRHVKYKFDNELKTLRDSPGVTATGTGQYSTHDFYFVLVALQWTLRFFDELSKLERHVWGTFVEGDRTTIALGGKGVIVPGCEACRKRIGTNSQYLRHLADDMLPAIFSGCAQRRELSAALGLKAFALLRRKQSREIHVDLANLAVGTGHRYAITSHRARRAANEVIAFVRGENEQRIL